MDNRAFFQLSYGVYIVSAASGDALNGCVINTACQVTSAPARLSVTVNKDNLTCQMIRESGAFAVHALTEGASLPFIGRFGFQSGRDIRKFAGLEVTLDANGCPCLLDSPEVGAVISCKSIDSVDVGTHILFVGEVTDAVVTGYAPPMTYAHYHQVKKGVTPPKSSAYQPAEAPAGTPSDAPRWRCSVCGHIHEGDTPPETCPICGKPASVFNKT